MRQLPEYCAECGRQIATLETCVLPDGSEKRGAEVTFKESAEGGIRCKGCADGGREFDGNGNRTPDSFDRGRRTHGF